MFLNNGGPMTPINSRNKRKEVSPDVRSAGRPLMVPETPNYKACYDLQHVRTALCLLEKQPSPPSPLTPQNALPLPHSLSFTSLLNEDRVAEIVEQGDQIDGIIRTHAEQLQRALAEKWQGHYRTLVCTAEERAAKRLKERETEMEKKVRRIAELEQMAAHYAHETQTWRVKAMRLGKAVVGLRAELRKATTIRGGGGGEAAAAAEDAESSYVDPDRVDPVSLACKGCGKRVATVMMWPCRHVCVCKGCDVVTKACLVCRSAKTTSIEVVLS